jgi:hypothetical protein
MGEEPAVDLMAEVEQRLAWLGTSLPDTVDVVALGRIDYGRHDDSHRCRLDRGRGCSTLCDRNRVDLRAWLSARKLTPTRGAEG